MLASWTSSSRPFDRLLPVWLVALRWCLASGQETTTTIGSFSSTMGMGSSEVETTSTIGSFSSTMGMGSSEVETTSTMGIFSSTLSNTMFYFSSSTSGTSGNSSGPAANAFATLYSGLSGGVADMPIYYGSDDFAVVYSASSNSAYFFGGSETPIYTFNQFLISTSSWSTLNAAGGPPATFLTGHCMDFNEAANAVILYSGMAYPSDVGAGGGATLSLPNGFWLYRLSNNSWSSYGGYTDVYNHACAMYQGQNRFYSHGGQWQGTAMSNSALVYFAFSSNSWSSVPATGVAPARVKHKMAIDESSGTIYLAGGASVTGSLMTDLYRITVTASPATWTLMTPPTPLRRINPLFGFSNATKSLFLYGGDDTSGTGYSSDFWVVTTPGATPSFAQISALNPPPALMVAGSSGMMSSGPILKFFARVGSGLALFAYNAAPYVPTTTLTTTTTAATRAAASCAATACAAPAVNLLWGQGTSTDVCCVQAGWWLEYKGLTGGPAFGGNFSAAINLPNVFVYGGTGYSPALLFKLDLSTSTWATIVTPASGMVTNGISTLIGHCLVYDTTANRLLVHGGMSPMGGTYPPRQKNFWSLGMDATEWSLMSIAAGQFSVGFNEVAFHACVFHKGQSRLYYQGGAYLQIMFPDLAYYDTPSMTWNSPRSGGQLPSLVRHSMAIDEVGGNIYLAGGLTASNPQNPSTASNSIFMGAIPALGGTMTWTRITPPSSYVARIAPFVAWLPAANRLFILGGNTTLGTRSSDEFVTSGNSLSFTTRISVDAAGIAYLDSGGGGSIVPGPPSAPNTIFLVGADPTGFRVFSREASGLVLSTTSTAPTTTTAAALDAMIVGSGYIIVSDPEVCFIPSASDALSQSIYSRAMVPQTWIQSSVTSLNATACSCSFTIRVPQGLATAYPPAMIQSRLSTFDSNWRDSLNQGLNQAGLPGSSIIAGAIGLQVFDYRSPTSARPSMTEVPTTTAVPLDASIVGTGYIIVTNLDYCYGLLDTALSQTVVQRAELPDTWVQSVSGSINETACAFRFTISVPLGAAMDRPPSTIQSQLSTFDSAWVTSLNQALGNGDIPSQAVLEGAITEIVVTDYRTRTSAETAATTSTTGSPPRSTVAPYTGDASATISGTFVAVIKAGSTKTAADAANNPATTLAIRQAISAQTGLPVSWIVVNLQASRLRRLQSSGTSLLVSWQIVIPVGSGVDLAPVIAALFPTPGVTDSITPALEANINSNLVQVGIPVTALTIGVSQLSQPVVSYKNTGASPTVNLVAIIAGAAGGAGGLLLVCCICCCILCRRPRGGVAQLKVKEDGPMEAVKWHLQQGKKPTDEVARQTSTHADALQEQIDQEDAKQVRVVWDIDLKNVEQYGFAMPKMETDGKPEKQGQTQLPTLRLAILGQPGQAGESRKNRRSAARGQEVVHDAFAPGESVEYYSSSNSCWTHGTVGRRDGYLENTIAYSVTAGNTNHHRPWVCCDQLRPLLQPGEPVSFQVGSKWVPGTIQDQCPIGLANRKYSVKDEKSGKVYHALGAERIQRRYDVGSSVFVYQGPLSGWRKGTVRSVAFDRAPPVRPKVTRQEEIPVWEIVTVQLEPMGNRAGEDAQAEELQVSAYYLRSKEPSFPAASTAPSKPSQAVEAEGIYEGTVELGTARTLDAVSPRPLPTSI